MTLDLTIPDLLAALFAGGAVLLSLGIGGMLLVGRGPHPVARRFLGGFLVAGGLTLTNELVYTLQLQRLSPHFWITPLLYTFSLGPLIYLFVRHRLDPERRLFRRDLWHAVVPGVQILHEVVTGFGTLALKDAYWQSAYGRAYSSVEIYLFLLSFGGYLIASARLLRDTRQTGDLRVWLRRLVIGCAVIVGVAAVMETSLVTPLLRRLVPETAFVWLKVAEMIAYASLLYWVAFTGFVHSLPRHAPSTPRAETYGLDAAEVDRLVARLRAHVEESRPYLDPQLTLGTLADRLGMGEKELSYVLNEGLGVSYTDYVNGLRVAEAQRRLGDPERTAETVLQIGMDAGFASKATFNRVFKQVTGDTPSAFRQAPRRLNPS